MLLRFSFQQRMMMWCVSLVQVTWGIKNLRRCFIVLWHYRTEASLPKSENDKRRSGNYIIRPTSHVTYTKLWRHELLEPETAQEKKNYYLAVLHEHMVILIYQYLMYHYKESNIQPKSNVWVLLNEQQSDGSQHIHITRHKTPPKNLSNYVSRKHWFQGARSDHYLKGLRKGIN